MKDDADTDSHHDKIDDAKNDAVNDAIDSGDPLDEDIEDYFDIIYGNGDSGTNP